MDLPYICQRAPFKQELQPGTQYSWCTCGLSKDGPFCDGNHKIPEPTGFKSHKFTVEEGKPYFLCGCKHTKTPPYCDGSHKNLPL